MEADFSGYATKAGLKCSDGRTIMPGAFKHQDRMTVPLVWQHRHTDPQNILGHAILESREDGDMYAYGYFNDTEPAKHAKSLLEHGDINRLSIWANELIERSQRVMHGVIREVSLVISGANPGAVIENVTIRHGDGELFTLEDEADIFTGLDLEHSSMDDESQESEEETQSEEESSEDTSTEDDSSNDTESDSNENDESDNSGEDDSDAGDDVQHADANTTLQDIIDTMNEEQKNVLYFMINDAFEQAADELKQDNLNDTDSTKGTEMRTNVFDDKKEGQSGYQLTHSDLDSIVADASRLGSLKDAAKAFALSHGIEDIDVLFPDATAVSNTPEFLARRTEWVAKVLGAARKSPFSRLKTLSADITEDEARAKGYIKGNLKKEEFFGVAKRVTTPTTVYKKQKLDRDDMVDITDFDVVAWLKGEMRLMLDEEIARAILIGDGRDVASEDKINEQNIRPIASDHELFTTTVNVNILDASSSITEMVDAIVGNRHLYKGTGLPTMFTTETVISKFLLLKDTLGRYIYNSLSEVATKLRVDEIVPVEVMEETPEILAILVNMNDYTVGATAGGQVSLFDDFDIDYNQYKYLIETRMCGTLTKLKSAIVVKGVASTDVLAVPTMPGFDGEDITIPTVTGVTYKDGATTVTGTVAVPAGESKTITAVADTGYYFATSAGDEWKFTNSNEP